MDSPMKPKSGMTLTRSADMITVDTLRRCAWLSGVHLEELLRKSYPEDVILGADFVGISNGGQFCYNVTHPDGDSPTGVARSKVFVWQESNGEIRADY